MILEEIQSPHLPARVFSSSYCDYFLDLYKRDFNFEQLIQNHINEGKAYIHLKAQIAKEKTHFSFLEFAILCGFMKIFDFLMETLSQAADIEINYLITFVLEKGGYAIFQKMILALFPDDISQVFDFIMNNDLIMKIATLGHEDFLISLFKDYIIPMGNKKIIPENKLIFSSNKYDISINNINLFHYISFHKMGHFMYIFLDYLMAFKFEADWKKMKYFLEEFMLMKAEIVKSNDIVLRTPISYALKNKFYEMINLCEINDILIVSNELKASFLLDLGVKNAGLAYFSRFFFNDNINLKYKLEKNNFFYEKYQNHLNLFNKLKPLLAFNMRQTTKNAKIKKKEDKKEKKEKKDKNAVKIFKRPKGPKIPDYEINYILEALIFGRKILEIEPDFMKKIRLFLKKSKDCSIFYLFFETFPSEIKSFPEIDEFLFIRNEAFIFYLLDRFFSNAKKSDGLLNPFDICKRFSLKNRNSDIMNQIFISPEIAGLLKSLQQKLKIEIALKSEIGLLKLDPKKINALMMFSIQNNFRYLLSYLMNLFPSDFLMNIDEKLQKESFFINILAYDSQLSYRLLKILEKSNVYLLLEKEFGTYFENFFNFDQEKLNIRVLIETFKVLLILISEEGYYSHSIFQITNVQKTEEALLSIFGKFMEKIGNLASIKASLDAMINEFQGLDLEEIIQYNYITKSANKQDIIIGYMKPLLGFFLDFKRKQWKKFQLDADSLEALINRVFDEKLRKFEGDFQHISMFLAWGISFYLTILEGYGVYEEFVREFEGFEFIFYFLKMNEEAEFSLIKEKNNVFHININLKVDFDEKKQSLGWKFNNEAYNNLKIIIRELTFERNLA